MGIDFVCYLSHLDRVVFFFEHESFFKRDSFKDRHITTTHPNSDILFSLVLSVFFLRFILMQLCIILSPYIKRYQIFLFFFVLCWLHFSFEPFE